MVTEVDPGFITSAFWGDIETTLLFLWMLWVTVISAAIFFLLGHAVVPSLAFTGHAGARARTLRPVFYALAIAAALGAAFSLVNFLGAAGVLIDIYPKVWI